MSEDRTCSYVCTRARMLRYSHLLRSQNRTNKPKGPLITTSTDQPQFFTTKAIDGHRHLHKDDPDIRPTRCRQSHQENFNYVMALCNSVTWMIVLANQTRR